MTNLIAMQTVELSNGFLSSIPPWNFSDHAGIKHLAVDENVGDIITTIEDRSDIFQDNFRSYNDQKTFWSDYDEDTYKSDGVKDSYRSDMISDVNSGLHVLVSGIKVVSAILTLLGGGSNRRGDEYEEAVQSLMSFGSAMLRVGGTNLLDYFSSPSSSSGPVAVNKLGVAADTGDNSLSQEEILHRIQVQKIVSTLSPEQIQEQQSVVFSHIQQAQIKDNLTDEEATKLLIETLEHNGLPVPESLQQGSNQKTEDDNDIVEAVEDQNMMNKLNSLMAGATGMISSILSPSSSQPTDTPGQVSSLPQPGTMEHTVMLGLFNAQQSVNMLLMDMFGEDTVDTNHIGGHFVKSDKLGQAAGTTLGQPSPESGILASMAALPQYVGTTAYQLVKFILPPSSTGQESQTYSESQSGLDPAHAALGVLATGAIGSVVYSYVAADSNLVTSVANLAMGAVEAVKRKGVASAAADAFASVTAIVDEEEEDVGNLDYKYYDDYIYAPSGYSDYGYGYPSPDRYYQSQEELEGGLVPDDDPREHVQIPYDDHYDHFQIPDNDPAPQKVPDSIQFYEPEHNPWMFAGSGQSTDHLYRSLGKRGAETETNSSV